MSSARAGDNSAVAYLVFRDTRRPGCQRGLSVRPNDEFDVGRKDVSELTGSNERTISTHHLRIRCIVYEDGEQPVTPMVYMSVLSTNAPQIVRCGIHADLKPRVPRGPGDVLLNHGDVVKLTAHISILFRADDVQHVSRSAFDGIKKAELKRMSHQYIITDRLIGSGASAGVFVALESWSGRQVACKIVSRPQATSDGLKIMNEKLAREHHVLKNLSHPNIISLEKVICSPGNIYIFQELITGGDLLSYLDQSGPLLEPEAISITYQLLRAVDYLHEHGVVHRDIKPENVLMTSWRHGARLILTDFGQARKVEGGSAAVGNSAVFRMQSLVGTRGYTAPEARLVSLTHPQHDDFCSNSEASNQIKQNLEGQTYGRGIDIWSIGCVTATCLTNEILFPNDDFDEPTDGTSCIDRDVHSRWNIGIIEYGQAWRQVGPNAKNFVKSCLAVNERERLTAKEALAHKWLSHRHYAGDLEAAYARAIKDWKPRKRSDDLIEYIDTSDAVPPKSGIDRVQRVAEEAKSRFFKTPFPPAHMALTFALHNGESVQHARSNTPLPPISRDSQDDAYMEFLSPQHTSDDSRTSDDVHAPLKQSQTDQQMPPLSIEDFAPPQAHLTFSVDTTAAPRLPPLTCNDSLTQFGARMLEKFRPA